MFPVLAVLLVWLGLGHFEWAGYMAVVLLAQVAMWLTWSTKVRVYGRWPTTKIDGVNYKLEGEMMVDGPFDYVIFDRTVYREERGGSTLLTNKGEAERIFALFLERMDRAGQTYGILSDYESLEELYEASGHAVPNSVRCASSAA